MTDNGIWAFLDLNYLIGSGDLQFPQTRKVVVVHLDEKNGEPLGWFESPDTSGAFVVPDADGTLYLTLSGAASSISYFGINDQLPFFLRSPLQPVGGLVALRPVDRSTL